MTLADSTLWTNPARTRFFVVPDGQEFPPGEFTICTTTGREAKVDEATLPGFEVTEDQAKSWVKEEFGKLLDGVRHAADGFVAKLRGES